MRSGGHRGRAADRLTPQESYIRKLQHQLADRYNLGSRSKGREPNRHVEIYRVTAPIAP